MENIRKHRNIKLVTNQEKYLQTVMKPNFKYIEERAKAKPRKCKLYKLGKVSLVKITNLH